MNTSPLHVATAALVVLMLGRASGADEPDDAPIPVLLDTDIGGEFDDALALGLVLASPELELRGVTTVHGDAHTRAMLVCRFLYALGREDVPVAAGAPPRDKPDLEGQMQYGLRAAQKHPVKESAADFLYEKLKAEPGQVTIIAIGPLTNIAELFEKHPGAVKLVKRVVLMGGSFKIGYNGKPPAEPEYNIKSDVAAAKKVFASGAPLVVVPLDATAKMKLENGPLRLLLTTETIVARQLRALYQLWGKKTPELFDPVAVAVATTDAALRGEPFGVKGTKETIVIDEDGTTRLAPGAANAIVVGSPKNPVGDLLVTRMVYPRLPKSVWGEVANLRLCNDDKIRFSGNVVSRRQLVEILDVAKASGSLPKKANVQATAEVPVRKLLEVYDLLAKAGIQDLTLLTSEDPAPIASAIIPRGPFPRRIHVIEDYETDIERRWCLSGKLETKDVPTGSKRACRAVLCNDFDDLMGDRWAMYQAVIFNPVPGPPMGKNTRLAFRYKLSGSDTLRVQIYSLSNGYHRHLSLTDLKQGEWQEAAVDMTDARRPDGSGGALSEDERIDDIQFYADAKAELLIDDILLYDAADEGEERPFPSRPIFTAWFDTGEQGKEWPGLFEIVPHEKPRTWDAARAVPAKDGKHKEIYLDLRGPRMLGKKTKVQFGYELRGAEQIDIALVGAEESKTWSQQFKAPSGHWAKAVATFDIDATPAKAIGLHFTIPAEADLLVDDVLLYE